MKLKKPDNCICQYIYDILLRQKFYLTTVYINIMELWHIGHIGTLDWESEFGCYAAHIGNIKNGYSIFESTIDFFLYYSIFVIRLFDDVR